MTSKLPVLKAARFPRPSRTLERKRKAEMIQKEVARGKRSPAEGLKLLRSLR